MHDQPLHAQTIGNADGWGTLADNDDTVGTGVHEQLSERCHRHSRGAANVDSTREGYREHDPVCSCPGLFCRWQNVGLRKPPLAG